MLVQSSHNLRSGVRSTLIAGIACLALALGAGVALAQHGGGGHGGGGGGGGGGGSSHVGGDSHTSHDSGHTSHSGAVRGKKGKGTRETGSGRGSGRSLRGVFRDLDKGARADTSSTSKGKGKAAKSTSKGKGKTAKSTSKGKGKAATTSVAGTKKTTPKGQKPTTAVAKKGKPTIKAVAADSGPPADKGGGPPLPGSKKGDLFGDLYVIDRNDNGVPILTELADGTWVVQPIDADGVAIPLDEEGHPIDESLVQEVEIGRLNVGRAPKNVLDTRLDEVKTLLNAATEIKLDPAGRLVLSVDGEEKTIDSPLENLAIYKTLLTEGYIVEGELPSVEGVDLSYMVKDEDDEGPTLEDLAASTVFLAAATDKTGEFTTDKIAYINAFLDINTTTHDDNVTVTYSDIKYDEGFTYDRADTYDTVTATVLVETSPGTWEEKDVYVYGEVFNSVDYSGSGSLEVYTQAADDARAVIEFIHENAVPETTTSAVTTGSVNPQQ